MSDSVIISDDRIGVTPGSSEVLPAMAADRLRDLMHNSFQSIAIKEERIARSPAQVLPKTLLGASLLRKTDCEVRETIIRPRPVCESVDELCIEFGDYILSGDTRREFSLHEGVYGLIRRAYPSDLCQIPSNDALPPSTSEIQR
jgi:hypothetical protein